MFLYVSTNQKKALTNIEKSKQFCDGLLSHFKSILPSSMFRSRYAALRGELFQEWQGEQGGLGRLHQDDQEEH